MTMRIDNASWGKMNYARHCLSGAKSRKALHAKELEQLRLAMEYMRGLRHWLCVASSEKKLKDRKAELARHIERINAMAMRRAAIECCELNLVGDSCQSNIRAAMTWATATTGANSFKDWDECVYNVNACIADALVQLDVVLCRVKSSWKQAKADMITTRTVIDTCAKDILHPVALPKAVRKEMIRVYCAKKVTQVFTRGTDNRILYSVVNAPSNTYHLVSAAGCISEREKGTVLGIKNWLRLVRTTRYNHVHRNAHNLNNRQDYLVRLNVDTSKVIRLR